MRKTLLWISWVILVIACYKYEYWIVFGAFLTLGPALFFSDKN